MSRASGSNSFLNSGHSVKGNQMQAKGQNRSRITRLIEPDDFKGDWYGWLTNQASHALIGVVVMGVAWFIKADIAYAFATMVIVYALVIEGMFQGFRMPRDSIVDTWFVCLGGLISVSLTHNSLKMYVITIVAGAISFGFGCWRRGR